MSPPPPAAQATFGVSVTFPNPLNVFVPPPPAPVAMAAASFVECLRCHGQRGINVWGKPCAPGHMHFKVSCWACGGHGQVDARLRPCGTCAGEGNFDVWDKHCPPTSMHCKRACHVCQGKGVVF